MNANETSRDGVGNENGSRADPVDPEGLEPQIVLILVGLPGSSKSTLSNALVSHSHSATWSLPSDGVLGGDEYEAHLERQGSAPLKSELPARQVLRRRVWTRVSQDESPNRRRQECEAALREALHRGENVVVDRVNFDPTQRAHFVNIAETHTPRPRIWALTLQVSDQTLRNRLEKRPWHPTIPDAETGYRVLSQMKGTFSPPRVDRPEGFDRISTLLERDQPPRGEWGEEGLMCLLRDISRKGEKEVGERKVVQVQRRSEYGSWANSPNGTGYRGGHPAYGGNGHRGRGGSGYAGRGRGDWRGGYSSAQAQGYRPQPPNGGYNQPEYGNAYRSGQHTGFQTTQVASTGYSTPTQGYGADGYPTYHPRPTQYGSPQIQPPFEVQSKPANDARGAP